MTAPNHAPESPPALARVERRTFRAGETAVLDGHLFVDCRFLGCTLEYSGGEFRFEGRHYFEAIQWSFRGCANRTVGLLSQLVKTNPEIAQQLFPELFQPPSERIQ